MNKRMSDIELQLFKICIELGEATARQVYDELLKVHPKKYMTIKTELDRIYLKGYLKRRKLGPIYLYTPTISKSHFVSGAVEDLVKNVLDNNVSPLLTFLIKNKKKISEDELNHLKQLIDETKEEE
jgi:predicted transcriptional regulator